MRNFTRPRNILPTAVVVMRISLQVRESFVRQNCYKTFCLVYDVKSVSNMKLLMQNLKLDEIKQYSNQLSKLDSELSSLINTSKYDLAPSWPTGKYWSLVTALF